MRYVFTMHLNVLWGNIYRNRKNINSHINVPNKYRYNSIFILIQKVSRKFINLEIGHVQHIFFTILFINELKFSSSITVTLAHPMTRTRDILDTYNTIIEQNDFPGFIYS